MGSTKGHEISFIALVDLLYWTQWPKMQIMINHQINYKPSINREVCPNSLQFATPRCPLSLAFTPLEFAETARGAAGGAGGPGGTWGIQKIAAKERTAVQNNVRICQVMLSMLCLGKSECLRWCHSWHQMIVPVMRTVCFQDGKSLAPKVIPNLRWHWLFEQFLRWVLWTCISSMRFPRPDQSLQQPVQAHLVEAAE